MTPRLLWMPVVVVAASGLLRGQGAIPTPAPVAAVTVDARAVQPGEIVVLTVVPRSAVDGVRARAFDRDWTGFQTSDGTWQVAIGLDLDTGPGRHTVALDVGGARVTHVLEVTAKAFPTRRLTVEPQYVDPPADVLDRILREADLLANVWISSPNERRWSDPFRRPVPHPANSAFGSRSVFNGQARSPHGGADFLSPTGTPVEAPNAGRVVVARDLYYTGQTVAIDHGLGLVSLFAHLSRIDVAEGDDVAAGRVVGLVGSTGRVTGPHLHWTLRYNGARVDPLSLLAVLGS